MYKNLAKTKLFNGFTQNEIEDFLKNSTYYTKTFEKNNVIVSVGEKVNCIGIILKGIVNIEEYDFVGNENIMHSLKSFDTFLESAVFSSEKTLPFSAVCGEDCEILFIKSENFIKLKTQTYFEKLYFNILKMLADKNIEKTKKIEILSQRTTRQKIIMFLNMYSKKFKSKNFFIDFNREKMATFLSVDRSALSYELSKMKKENLLDYKKNKFILYY